MTVFVICVLFAVATALVLVGIEVDGRAQERARRIDTAHRHKAKERQ